LLGGGFESTTAGFRLGKLHAVDVEPFGALGAVSLGVEGRTVHLLAGASQIDALSDKVESGGGAKRRRIHTLNKGSSLGLNPHSSL
jgi:hypothetical protein